MIQYAEVPQGTIDGSNQVFTLVNAPNPILSLDLIVNGVGQSLQDYVLTGKIITLAATPQVGDQLIARSYTY